MILDPNLLRDRGIQIKLNGQPLQEPLQISFLGEPMDVEEIDNFMKDNNFTPSERCMVIDALTEQVNVMLLSKAIMSAHQELPGPSPAKKVERRESIAVAR